MNNNGFVIRFCAFLSPPFSCVELMDPSRHMTCFQSDMGERIYVCIRWCVHFISSSKPIEQRALGIRSDPIPSQPVNGSAFLHISGSREAICDLLCCNAAVKVVYQLARCTTPPYAAGRVRRARQGQARCATLVSKYSIGDLRLLFLHRERYGAQSKKKVFFLLKITYNRFNGKNYMY